MTERPTSEAAQQVHPPLLTLITRQSLDEDYLVAAERRAAGAPLPPRGRPRRVAALVVAVFGLLVSVAFVQTSRNADVDDASRATLIDRLDSESALLDRQQAFVAELRARNLDLENDASVLADTEQEALVRNRRLQVRTGFLGVTGEGVRITVTDRPDADPVQQVQDSDLALLVNGLWEAGAEAIAVNGQRLTGRTAIRTSGLAIEVNGTGIAGPYDVVAIGDRRTLSARLFDTTSGLVFAGNAETYGFTYTVDNVASLSLPAGPPGLLTLRSASSTDQSTGEDDRPSRATPDPDDRERGTDAMIAALGLLVGVLVGLLYAPDVPLGLEPYLPIAVVAALDAVFGGLRAYLDGIFDDKVFVVSFVSNVFIAAGIVYLGDQLGVGGQLSTGRHRRPGDPHLLQRRRHPAAPVPCLSAPWKSPPSPPTARCRHPRTPGVVGCGSRCANPRAARSSSRSCWPSWASPRSSRSARPRSPRATPACASRT